MTAKTPLPRVALSPKEFAELFGKSQTWGYRKIYEGKVKTITEYGRILIPAAEVERILGEAGIYDGLKAKVPKRNGKLDAWRKFINERRQGKVESVKVPNRPALSRLHSSSVSARTESSLARFTKRNKEN